MHSSSVVSWYAKKGLVPVEYMLTKQNHIPRDYSTGFAFCQTLCGSPTHALNIPIQRRLSPTAIRVKLFSHLQIQSNGSHSSFLHTLQQTPKKKKTTTKSNHTHSRSPLSSSLFSISLYTCIRN